MLSTLGSPLHDAKAAVAGWNKPMREHHVVLSAMQSKALLATS